MSFKARILVIVALASGLCAIVAILGFLHFNRQELINGIINKERTIHRQLEAAKEFVARQGGLDEVIEKFRLKYRSPQEISREDRLKILNQVPIFSAMVIGKRNAEKDNYQFRIFSDNPRREEYLPNEVEKRILEKFESDPSLEEQIFNDGKTVTLYRPVRLSREQGCLTCHGDPRLSPWGNGTDILGYPMENWQDGQIHGVFAVSQIIEEVGLSSQQGQLMTPAKWLILSILLGAILAVFLGAIMVRGPIKRLNHVTAILSNASFEVNSASQQISSTSETLSQASVEQASSLQETASSLEQINAMIGKASQSASSTADCSYESLQKAEEGQAAVGQMLSSMEEIGQGQDTILDQVNESNQKLADIVNVIQEIGNKTKVIHEIVFQTKLLSFNASVEAARAGEHGKGFAVVAEEVGNLAQMSGQAAKDISEILGNGMSKIEHIIGETRFKVESLIEESRPKVREGVAISKRCSEILNEIVKSVSQVSTLSQEISLASKEQSLGVSEINKAMGQLDAVTQQNVTTSVDAARAADQLSSQAESLKSVVDELVVVIQGKRPMKQ